MLLTATAALALGGSLRLLLLSAVACAYPFLLPTTAALAKSMALPQTASLALPGPLTVPETGGGRAWFQAFDDDWELIQVCGVSGVRERGVGGAR